LESGAFVLEGGHGDGLDIGGQEVAAAGDVVAASSRPHQKAKGKGQKAKGRKALSPLHRHFQARAGSRRLAASSTALVAARRRLSATAQSHNPVGRAASLTMRSTRISLEPVTSTWVGASCVDRRTRTRSPASAAVAASGETISLVST